MYTNYIINNIKSFYVSVTNQDNKFQTKWAQDWAKDGNILGGGRMKKREEIEV